MKSFSVHFAVALALMLALALTLGGCGTTTNLPEIDEGLAKAEAKKQRILAIEETHRMTLRLTSVSYPILTANAELCPETEYTSGLGFASTRGEDEDEDANEALREVFDLGEYAKIIQVLRSSPADAAGLLTGDEVIAVNGVKVPGDVDAAKWIIESSNDASKDGQVYTITIVRSGKQIVAPVTPKAICAYPIGLSPNSGVNAYADGRRIMVSADMMRFANDDNYLALVLGHELAHNTMAHIPKKTGNALLGAVLGAAVGIFVGVDLTNVGSDIGAGFNSQDFEAEADYVGVYYVARAGYDIANAARFWRLMGAAHPRIIHLAGTTHPSSAKRYIAIERTRDEIKAKQAAGEALRPDSAKD